MLHAFAVQIGGIPQNSERDKCCVGMSTLVSDRFVDHYLVEISGVKTVTLTVEN